MTRSEPQPEPAVREWVVQVRNVLMLQPLLPFDVRPAGRDRASVGGSAVLLRPGALRLSAARFRSSLLRLRAALFRPSLLRRATAAFGSRFCCTPRWTMLRKVLPGTLIPLRTMLFPPFLLASPVLSIQALTDANEQTH